MFFTALQLLADVMVGKIHIMLISVLIKAFLCLSNLSSFTHLYFCIRDKHFRRLAHAKSFSH